MLKRIESSTLVFLHFDRVTNTLPSDIKESYMQYEQFRLLLDHFGGRKVTLPLHLKANPNRLNIAMVYYGINYPLAVH